MTTEKEDTFDPMEMIPGSNIHRDIANQIIEESLENGINEEKQPEEPQPEPYYPLISCIMPTTGRAALVGQAVQMFLEQDYPNKELIASSTASL